MRKLFLSIAFVLIAQMSMAQEANFKADVLKLISISGADTQIKVIKPQILNMIPEDKKENFSKEFDASIPSLHDKMAKIYMEIYSPEDIKGMLAFYESPVGKKMNEKAGELGQKSLQAGQEWGQELQGIMAKYKDVVPAQNTYSVTKPK
ncbi:MULTISPECIES: DUF2059 domain-containing protein [unclassified Flavobacterium]|jgi:hypothetical protein|uniref:DUF2059 domain-containing protein n=1 Tax=unclassified Flavobacterium TaxID=196869 RepID=UPI0025C319A8|nr:MULTISPECIES: DUF2059 domain-containing protein [unclassified Flavobacterium]